MADKAGKYQIIGRIVGYTLGFAAGISTVASYSKETFSDLITDWKPHFDRLGDFPVWRDAFVSVTPAVLGGEICSNLGKRLDNRVAKKKAVQTNA